VFIVNHHDEAGLVLFSDIQKHAIGMLPLELVSVRHVLFLAPKTRLVVAKEVFKNRIEKGTEPLGFIDKPIVRLAKTVRLSLFDRCGSVRQPLIQNYRTDQDPFVSESVPPRIRIRHEFHPGTNARIPT